MSMTIDNLRSDSYFSAEEKNSFMWELVGDDQEFILEIEPRKHYECTLCDKSPRSQYCLVEHVWSSHHRIEADHKRNLTDAARQAVAQLEGQGFGKNFSVHGGSGEALGFKCRICSRRAGLLDTMSEIIRHVKSSGHQGKLVVMRSFFKLKTDSSLSRPQKVRAMWKLVREFEGEYYTKGHFERTGTHSFECTICNVSMASPFNVAQHAHGKKHQITLGSLYGRSDSGGETYEEQGFSDEVGYLYYGGKYYDYY